MDDDGFEWAFVKRQCWHCDDPACVRACPAGAITKYDEGPVIIDPAKCTGCKYCVDACPFGIPRYDSATEKVYKCHFCYDRIRNGLPPACIQACTTGSLQFDELEKLRAKSRVMGASPKRTSVMYTMPTFRDGSQPTETQLKLDPTPADKSTWQLRSIVNPLGVLGTAATLIGGFVYVIKHRAHRVKEEEGGL